MSISLIGSLIDGPGSGGGATPPMDTTGADLLVMIVGGVSMTNTVSDSKSNTWNALTRYNWGTGECQMHYAYNATVGTNHTFTFSEASSFPGIAVLAYSGALTTSDPFDQESGTGSQAASRQPGSITPGFDGALFVTANEFTNSHNAPSVDSGFTIQESLSWSSGVNVGVYAGDLVQTTAAALNPTWSWTGSEQGVTIMATFKPAPTDGASGTPRRLMLMGVG